MSQLISMSQRIQTVETMRKVTHAMRLVSMSAHTRLASRQNTLEHYKQEITTLLSQIKAQIPNWQHPLFDAHKSGSGSLILLVGSQKGLCGTFNAMLTRFFEHRVTTLGPNDQIIAIGKKAEEYLTRRKIKPAKIFNNMTLSTLTKITDVIAAFVSQEGPRFERIVFMSNWPQTFFHQKPVETYILPMQTVENTHKRTLASSYLWYESSTQVLDSLAQLYLHASVETILFSSLLAEQAARFRSMDKATRNADDTLEILRRDYNKLRQAKITKELLELASGTQR